MTKIVSYVYFLQFKREYNLLSISNLCRLGEKVNKTISFVNKTISLHFVPLSSRINLLNNISRTGWNYEIVTSHCLNFAEDLGAVKELMYLINNWKNTQIVIIKLRIHVVMFMYIILLKLAIPIYFYFDENILVTPNVDKFLYPFPV